MPGNSDILPSLMRSLYRGLATANIRGSALAPFLMACLIISVPCFTIAAFCDNGFRFYMFAAGATPLGVFVIAALYLLFFDRDRLHTEQHLEKKQALDIVEAKGKGLLVDPVDLVNMVNPTPEQRKLSSGEEGGLSNG